MQNLPNSRANIAPPRKILQILKQFLQILKVGYAFSRLLHVVDSVRITNPRYYLRAHCKCTRTGINGDEENDHILHPHLYKKQS